MHRVPEFSGFANSMPHGASAPFAEYVRGMDETLLGVIGSVGDQDALDISTRAPPHDESAMVTSETEPEARSLRAPAEKGPKMPKGQKSMLQEALGSIEATGSDWTELVAEDPEALRNLRKYMKTKGSGGASVSVGAGPRPRSTAGRSTGGSGRGNKSAAIRGEYEITEEGDISIDRGAFLETGAGQEGQEGQGFLQDYEILSMYSSSDDEIQYDYRVEDNLCPTSRVQELHGAAAEAVMKVPGSKKKSKPAKNKIGIGNDTDDRAVYFSHLMQYIIRDDVLAVLEHMEHERETLHLGKTDRVVKKYTTKTNG